MNSFWLFLCLEIHCKCIQTETGALGTFLKEDYETLLEQHSLAAAGHHHSCVFPLISQALKRNSWHHFLGRLMKKPGQKNQILFQTNCSHCKPLAGLGESVPGHGKGLERGGFEGQTIQPKPFWDSMILH